MRKNEIEEEIINLNGVVNDGSANEETYYKLAVYNYAKYSQDFKKQNLDEHIMNMIEEYYNSALALNPQYIPAILGKAGLYTGRGRLDQQTAEKIKQDLKIALDIEPDNLDILGALDLLGCCDIYDKDGAIVDSNQSAVETERYMRRPLLSKKVAIIFIIVGWIVAFIVYMYMGNSH